MSSRCLTVYSPIAAPFISLPNLCAKHSRSGAPRRPPRTWRTTNLASVHVELLFWEGCPSHPRALADLRAALAAEGLDPDDVVVREITTEEQAAREVFVGSPTIRIDGVDVQDPGEEPAGLTCRLFRRRDGRISPTPDPADVRDAIRAASSIERSSR